MNKGIVDQYVRPCVNCSTGLEMICSLNLVYQAMPWINLVSPVTVAFSWRWILKYKFGAVPEWAIFFHFFRYKLLNTNNIGTHNFCTFLLTPWCRVLLEKLTGRQLVKKFHAFHGTRRFITALTSVRHLPLSWASPIQSIYPHPTSWRSVLILSTHLRLGLPSGLLPSGFPSKTLYTPLSSPIRSTTKTNLCFLCFYSTDSNVLL